MKRTKKEFTIPINTHIGTSPETIKEIESWPIENNIEDIFNEHEEYKNYKSAKGCPKCGSKNFVAHSDLKLRQEHKLVMQCFNCNHNWKVDLKDEY